MRTDAELRAQAPPLPTAAARRSAANGCEELVANDFLELRLGGDALGADPTYLLYLACRSRGELRRIDFEPDCAGATLSDFAASELTRKPLLHARGISRAKSFDLEVTRWAPTRLTSCISRIGPE